MRGLDAHIMGLYDPNAPFNQEDWPDYSDYQEILEYCPWIHDEMYKDNATYFALGRIFDEVVENFLWGYFRQHVWEWYKDEKRFALAMCAKDLAEEIFYRYGEWYYQS